MQESPPAYLQRQCFVSLPRNASPSSLLFLLDFLSFPSNISLFFFCVVHPFVKTFYRGPSAIAPLQQPPRMRWYSRVRSQIEAGSN
jgi:hypothetical protein